MSIVPCTELPARLERKIDKTSSPNGCWLWLGFRNPRGYGMTTDGENVRLAHRVVYSMLVRPIPAGLHACHHCDNPGCVNPAHIFLGTDLDNNRDMVAKGRDRHVTGPDNHKTKFTAEQVRAIRAAYDASPKKHGMLSKLAREYGVWPSAIQRVVRRKNWAHLD